MKRAWGKELLCRSLRIGKCTAPPQGIPIGRGVSPRPHGSSERGGRATAVTGNEREGGEKKLILPKFWRAPFQKMFLR